MKKYMAMGDFHKTSRYYRQVLPFIKDFKPDVLILGGDINDFDCISKFTAHKRGFVGHKDLWKQINQELCWLGEVLKEIEGVLPKEAKKVFMQGNHEDRYDNFAKYELTQRDPKERVYRHAAGFNDRFKHWQFVESNKYFRLGKVFFGHGTKFSAQHYAKAAALALRHNVRLFHHHTNQVFSLTSPLYGGDAIEVKGVGCLCDRDPAYLKGITNRWMHSFLAGHMFPNGDFNDYIVNIVHGKFVAPNGKLYQ